MYIRNSLLFLLFVTVLAGTSCSHKYRYLQAPEKTEQQEILYEKTFEEYHLQPGDVLHINVMTGKDEYTSLFKTTTMQTQGNISGSYLYLSGYPVDISGNIELPLVGNLQVAGLTTGEVEKLVHGKVSEIINDNKITVRLGGFRINIVGEVKTPGEYTVYRDQATIMEAISLAGDMNYYGNRKEIMIYRKTEKGTVPYSIDLTDRNALSSPVFYLQPNDMIYIQPLPRTIFRVNVSDIVTYLSAISTSLALIVAIVSLTK